jgi:hypothetical protein
MISKLLIGEVVKYSSLFYFKVLSWNLLGKTEERRKILRPRSEYGTSLLYDDKVWLKLMV